MPSHAPTLRALLGIIALATGQAFAASPDACAMNGGRQNCNPPVSGTKTAGNYSGVATATNSASEKSAEKGGADIPLDVLADWGAFLRSHDPIWQVLPDLQSRPLQAHGEVDYLADFHVLWGHAMGGFPRSADLRDVLIFAQESLAGTYYYARLFPSPSGDFVEESAPYAQSHLYCELARRCFASAQSHL